MDNAYGDVVIPELTLYKKGKVRNVYEIDDKLLIVATDRISAFDFVLPSLIPDKGKILTQLSKFWFDFTQLVCPEPSHHGGRREFPARPGQIPGDARQADDACEEDRTSFPWNALSADISPARAGKNIKRRGR